MKLLGAQNSQDRTYATPTRSELVGLVAGDIRQSSSSHDIRVEHRTNVLKRISELHPPFMAMQYLLLFPYGEDGYKLDINYVDSLVKQR